MEEKKANRIEIALPNGYKLVAEQNSDPQFSREMFIGVEEPTGVWQGLAVVRSSYHINDGSVVWNDELFDVLVFGSEDNEGFTEEFSIGLRQDED